ncbi:telomere length regulation protein [Geosmithia morbida]|uniref:Telomere length regulation protein n=1 Tax=Geosmithia morbida TaxID=1094350 RepID=A0A9P4YYK1_9HYPO|nr:telomere length regulation protein [Geosmithia morbida]KAF4124162.1 telomere length regulation protein [Geosmithia morbida]
MDLTPVSTTFLRARHEKAGDDHGPLLTEVVTTTKKSAPLKPSSIRSTEEALDSLKAQPDYDTLILTLQFLAGGALRDALGPQSAAIIRILVTEIAPNYWPLFLSDGSSDIALFIRCLQSVTGVNALISHLRGLIQESKNGSRHSKRPDIPLNLDLFLDILAATLEGDDTIQRLWVASVSGLPTQALQKAQSQALLSILTGGRLNSTTGEASAISGSREARHESQWVADGFQVSRWLGRNIASWAQETTQDAELRFCSDLFLRALSVGYPDTLIKSLIDSLILSPQSKPDLFARICLSSPSQGTKVLNTVLDFLSDKFLDGANGDDAVAAVAGAINSITRNNQLRIHDLVKWCVAASGAGLGRGIGIRRAVVAVLSQDKETVTTVLEKCLSQFGDELYIKHAPFLQQKEVLLLSAGYVYRLSPIKMTMIIRSGAYLSAISNRIAATQGNTRLLGMIVGESLSGLIDSKEKRLDFHMEEIDTDETERLKRLVHTSDLPRSIKSLLTHISVHDNPSPRQYDAPQTKPRQVRVQKPNLEPEAKPKVVVEEIDSSDDDEEDEGLAPYAKGFDPEDSDDDPTLVHRNKIRPPVYIRDLMAYLRDSESYEKQKIALQTAPVLIRRKANYGTEVSFHADGLAGLLVGVQDKFEMDDFDELRRQSMISLIVAQPQAMAPWFARTFFEGDYSLSQRMSVLIALGLAARDLAGFGKSEHQDAAAFASKRLPEKLEKIYLDSQGQSTGFPASQLQALPATALESITKSLTASFLEPLAAQAADATTGPDALKLETFSTRYKSRSAKKPRVRAIPNTTAAIIANSFFSPLTAHFQFALRSARPVVLHPTLLSLYLQTLGIMVHAAGPSTLSLPQLTAELWNLLLGVRQHVLGDVGATKGWLTAMAVLIDVNEGDMRRLCETQGREVVETREWVSDVFERTRGDDGGEENNVKMLAAGVLIRLGEAIEQYQALLMGDMIGF